MVARTYFAVKQEDCEHCSASKQNYLLPSLWRSAKLSPAFNPIRTVIEVQLWSLFSKENTERISFWSSDRENFQWTI